MKQTAVEWLFAEYINPKNQTSMASLFLEALQMEKEQMSDTWVDSRTFDKGDNYFGKQKSFDEYYNETYEKK
jgi:hypothetical protein